ncbi:hypothetical protein VPH35_014272 [Triticum aestivum]
MVCEALNDARRLAIHHPALLVPIMEKAVLIGRVKAVADWQGEEPAQRRAQDLHDGVHGYLHGLRQPLLEQQL